jgi:hypothetical protein
MAGMSDTIHLRLTAAEVDVLKSALDHYTNRDEFYESNAEDTAIASIEAKLEQHSRSSGWIRVDEWLPEEGELVWLLGFDEYGDEDIVIGKRTGDGSYLETNGHLWLGTDGIKGEEHECDLVVSLWHALPQLPQAIEGETAPLPQPPAREGE